MVTVALVDDHAIVRQGLHALLESDPNLHVVGDAANGLEAIKLVKRRKPRVVICDLIMTGLSGLDTVRKIIRLKLKIRVIMLSMYGNEGYVLEALKSGAAGYVLKESSGAELFQAIRVVVAGRRFVSPALAQNPVVAAYLQKVQPVVADPYDTLTKREREVLQSVVQWGTRRDIGAKPKIVSRAVKSQQASLMRKLGLNTHHNLIQYALGNKDAGAPGAELRQDTPESSAPPVNRVP